MNKELIIKDIETALAAHNWNQCSWHNKTECGTTHCVAGFADFRIAKEKDVDLANTIDFSDNLLLYDVLENWGVTERQWEWITNMDNDRERMLSILSVIKGEQDVDSEGVSIQGPYS